MWYFNGFTSSFSSSAASPQVILTAAQYFSSWCQSFKEIDLFEICLARDVKRCWFVGQIMSFMPKSQSINSCTFYSFTYSSTNPEILSRSCGSCWPPSIKSWFYLSIHHDRQNYEMAGGRSFVLHLSWVLCSCCNLYLDFKIWSSCSSHVWQRFSIHFFWTGVCSMLGILAYTTTSFYPQSNGIVERFHRSLKSSLQARLAGSDWFSHLPLVLLGLRATPKDDTGLSEAVYSSPLTLPGDVPELLPYTFLRKVNRWIRRFSASSCSSCSTCSTACSSCLS